MFRVRMIALCIIVTAIGFSFCLSNDAIAKSGGTKTTNVTKTKIHNPVKDDPKVSTSTGKTVPGGTTPANPSTGTGAPPR